MPQANSTGSGSLGYDALVYRDSVNDVTGQPSGPFPTGNAGANKLWLPLWSGEVINAYDQYNVFENLINTKTITSGFAYEFPITGSVALNASWDAGEELIGGDSASTTFKVALDKRPMAAHFETDNVDLLVTQWDYRSELARQAGLTLANTRDRQICMGLVAACALGPISGDPRLTTATPAGSLTTDAFHVPGIVASDANGPSGCSEAEALNVLQEIENYLVTCQENDIAVTDVYCAVTPKVFQVIRALGIPRTSGGSIPAGSFQQYPLFGASEEVGSLGAPLAMGMNTMMDSLDYMGVKIIKTNHLPKVDHAASAIGGSKYNLNASATSYSATGVTAGYTGFGIFGVIFQKEAIAGLSLMGMKVDTVQDVRRNTQFTVASMMKGTGVIRPELCKILIGATAGSATRAVLRDHLNGNGSSGAATNNLTNGFGAEYVVTS